MSPPNPAIATTRAAVTWLGTWARPTDRPAQIALAAGAFLVLLALLPGGPRWLGTMLDFARVTDLSRRRRFLSVAGFVAAFLSLGYVAYYLHGGPRSPMAATYWLQGRALSHGALAWALPDPSASFRVRDLLFTAPDRASGVFPPGYPLLLAPAFLVGAPMLVGPLLASALALATYALAREIALASAVRAPQAERIARVAAGLSVLSAALRYATAEVLPYGAAAVAVAAGLALALYARRANDARVFGAAGLAVGLLAATQPIAAVPVAAVVASLAWGARETRRAIVWAAVAAVPGVLLLLAANRAAAGHALSSPIAAYRRAFEPLASRTFVEALKVTGRGLRLHLLDVANLEPLALLAVVPLTRGARRAPALCALVVAGIVVLALPLDAADVAAGSGARTLAPALPVEHALVALALARLFPASMGAAAVGVYGLALAGFGLHASHDHRALAAEETGHPHYEPDAAREANVTHGLLFFDDDDGFALAFDPGVPASHGVQAVRLRGDDHDRLLYDALGHPAVHRYIAAAGSAEASVSPWSPVGGSGDTYRFEAESDWPPLATTGGRASVLTIPSGCASDGRALEVVPRDPARGDAVATIALPVPRGATPPDTRRWNLAPRVLQRGGAGSGTLTVVAALGGPALAEWTWEDLAKSQTCLDLPAKPLELPPDLARAWLLLRARGGPVVLDKTTLRH